MRLYLVILEIQRSFRAGFGVIGNISPNIFGLSVARFKI